jgi:hypothetical protein
MTWWNLTRWHVKNLWRVCLTCHKFLLVGCAARDTSPVPRVTPHPTITYLLSLYSLPLSICLPPATVLPPLVLPKNYYLKPCLIGSIRRLRNLPSLSARHAYEVTALSPMKCASGLLKRNFEIDLKNKKPLLFQRQFLRAKWFNSYYHYVSM